MDKAVPENTENGPENPHSRVRPKTKKWAAAGLGVAVVLVGGYFLLRGASSEDVALRGLDENPVRPSALNALRVEAGSADGIQVSIDGKSVPARQEGGAFALRPGKLPDGTHEVRVEVPRKISWLGSVTKTQEVTVDSKPPRLNVRDSLRPDGVGKPVRVMGKAQGASKVTVAGNTVKPGRDGSFSAMVQRPNSDVEVVATDGAGNRTERRVTVHIKHPGMRAVHMTGLAWTSSVLREPVLDMARQGKIDTVELDIKDESGEVPYNSAVPMANKIGAVKGHYNARQVLDQLHSMGVRVVGRLVAFKDPVLGKASWLNGHPERVVQTTSGEPWSSGYGEYAFTNFANREVRDYNIAIAAEAADLGFDDILYDYVRRPDGDITQMRLPQLRGTPEAGIAHFMRDTQEAVRSRGALLGASVFGIAVDRPKQIAQDVEQMSQYADYIAPMVYPSHWGPGEFGVGDPNAEPYQIVRRSLAEFEKSTGSSDAQVIPWLQDFDLGADYGPAQVRAQIDGARANGMNSFLLWAPDCRYTDAALRAVE